MPKKPKLTKEEKESLKRAEEERQLLEEELARQKAEEEERQRLERERLEREEQERIRLEEAAIREVQQEKLKVILKKLKVANIKNKAEIWYDIEWDHLMTRSDDPDPLNVVAVDIYVSDWAYEEEESMEDILSGIVHCLLLISDIDIALVYRPGVTEEDESSWDLNRKCMQDAIAEKLDVIIFQLLMDSNEYISTDSCNSENTFIYQKENKETPEDEEPLLSFCVWVNLSESARFRGMESPEMDLSFEIPHSLVVERCAVVMMHTSFDHVTRSHLSSKTYLPLEKLPEEVIEEAVIGKPEDKPDDTHNPEVDEYLIDGPDELVKKIPKYGYDEFETEEKSSESSEEEEPDAEELAEEPDAVEPETDIPVSSMPSAEGPDADKPEAGVLVTSEPDAAVTSEPDAAVTSEPDAAVTSEPDAAVTSEPSAVESDAAETGTKEARTAELEDREPKPLETGTDVSQENIADISETGELPEDNAETHPISNDEVLGEETGELVSPAALEGLQESMVEMLGESVGISESPRVAATISIPSLVEPEPDMVDFSGYYVIGGVFHYMLMEVPRLPAKAGGWIMIYAEGDEKPAIKKRHYKATIIPIRQPRPGMSPAEAAEFADAEIRRFESEMLEAISVTLRLPKNVLFLEQPIPAMWLPEKGGFTTSGFFDVKYEEETGSLSFKINQFSKIGIMTKKYANFPFQSWELKPNKDTHHSTLTINGALVLLEIEISDKGCSISSIHHGDNAIFPHLYESYMAPWQLVQKLSAIGINILAEDDGFEYIGVQKKNSWAEDWTYFCMSLLSSFCIFSWSRWNLIASFEQLVMKCTRLITIQPPESRRSSQDTDESENGEDQDVRASITASNEELKTKEAERQVTRASMAASSEKLKREKGEQEEHRTSMTADEYEEEEDEEPKEEPVFIPALVMVTPERAVYLKCGDTGETFSAEPIDGQTFCSDLYHLMIKDLPEEPIDKLEDAQMLFSINVYSLLSLCKVLSCA